jgi:hypothetical protein
MAIVAGPALAGVVTFTGELDDPANSALVASDMGAAEFGNDPDKANNVALYAVHVAVGGNVNFASAGFVPGGIDPYFSLFSGTDPASASFRESNYLHALSVGGDFTQDILLTAGDYTLAIGVFVNLSFAENLGSGVLADGFTGLGGPDYFGDGSYAFTVTLPDASVPEPSSAVLVLAAAGAAAWVCRRRRIRPATTTPTFHGGRS